MREDAERSMESLEVVTRISRHLTTSGLVVYRCRYDFMAFGSWVIEAGTSHRRVQVVRDGQGGTFGFSTARLQNAGAVPNWQQREEASLDMPPHELDQWVQGLIRKYGV